MEFESATVNGEPTVVVTVAIDDERTLREMATWCGGEVIAPGIGIALTDDLGSSVLALHGNRIIRQPSGGFSVLPRELFFSVKRRYCRAKSSYNAGGRKRGVWS